MLKNPKREIKEMEKKRNTLRQNLYHAQGEEKPYSCDSGYFRRLDGTTQKMTNHEMRLMFQENEIVPFEALREAIANVIIMPGLL